ncbi:peptidoglycan-binding protein [Streptomyces sp. NPDC005925]|uniref:peptidoglycan-binding protein n=1 Tax=Streptomyces sp. NPDC005925 TaxID=3157172 RepID=UPI00340724C3
MSRWNELPAELHPHVRQLIVRLRRLKDRSELSTRQLAAATGYSGRSWQRYLNGGSLPPRGAVEAIAEACGDDADRLLVLHEMAAERWAEGSRDTSDAWDSMSETLEVGPADRQSYTRVPQMVVAVGAAALAVSVSAALVLAVQLAKARASAEDTRERTVTAAGSGAASAPGRSPVLPSLYTCRPKQSDGRWYAGHSRTRESTVVYGQTGPEVIEVQCLLSRAGFSPGDIDGIFGPMTQRAVKRFQTREGLEADGVIGPLSWEALRGCCAEVTAEPAR